LIKLYQVFNYFILIILLVTVECWYNDEYEHLYMKYVEELYYRDENSWSREYMRCTVCLYIN